MTNSYKCNRNIIKLYGKLSFTIKILLTKRTFDNINQYLKFCF